MQRIQPTTRPEFIRKANGALSLHYGFLIVGTVRANGEGFQATTQCADGYYGWKVRRFETELKACAWLMDMLAQSEARA